LWGENLQIVITTADPEKLNEDPTCFNLIVQQKNDGIVLEMFRNVSLNQEKPGYIGKVLVDGVSTCLRVDGAIASSTIPLPVDADYQSNNVASDGNYPDSTTVIGNSETKTGMYALKNADMFNLLCVPAFDENDQTRKNVYTDALKFCDEKRAILLVDPQQNWNTKDSAKSNLNSYISRDKNGALYFPRIIAADPLQGYRLRDFDPSGVVAGVIARTDAQRGVWKAPAGIEATLVGVPDLSVRLTDEENGELNPLGINCLRILPTVGQVIWGSRTLRGADSLADQC
jgi:phage tail sheath protein FI